jgi:putative DNA primase/helicase
MTNEKGEYRAVQVISEDGKIKTFMRGAQKKGLMFVLGAGSLDELLQTHEGDVAFVEGMATGKSLYMALEIPVVVCFDAGNLESVIADCATLIPNRIRPLICIDNDQFHVERAIEHLSQKVGVKLTAGVDHDVSVRSDDEMTRTVHVGDLQTNGVWQQGPKGNYCVTLDLDDAQTVKALTVEIVLGDAQKAKMTFNNRGLEAGKVALAALQGCQINAEMVTPVFCSLQGRPSDWNDLHQREGLAAIRGVFKREVAKDLAHNVEQSVCVVER